MDRLAADRMFRAVAEAGSFVKGAAAVGVSAGQASKLVGRLEETLGVRLFNRTTRALSLTEDGRAYLERIRELLDEYEALDRSITDRDGVSGRLRVTAPHTFGRTRLLPALLAFATMHPAVSLEVDLSDRMVSLVDEGYDLAVRIGRLADSSLTARPLISAKVETVASPALLSRHPPVRSPDDLRALPCIIDTNFREPLIWRYGVPGGEAVRVGVAGRMRFSDAEACVAAAVAGFGVARTPDFVAQPHVLDGRLAVILADFAGEELPVTALYPSGRKATGKVRALIDHLRATLNQPAS